MVLSFRFGHAVFSTLSLDTEPRNRGVAVGLSLISCMGVAVHVFEGLEAAILDIPLPVWSNIILISLIA